MIAQHPEAGELRGDLLRLLALLAYDSAPQRAREWMKESLAIARQIGNAAQIAETLLVFAQIEITGGGDNDAGHDYRREALALYEDSSDRLGIARALVLEFSPEAWEQSLGMFRQIGHLRGIADVLTHLARNLHQHGAPGRAWELLLEARQNYQELGDIGGEVWVLLGLGDIAQSTTRLVDAADYYNRAQELAQLSFDLNGKAWAEHNLGEVLARRQETLEAVRLFRGAINHFRRSQYPFGLVMSLADAAYIAWSAGDYDQGVRFLAALDNDCRTVAGVPFEQDVAPEHAIFFRFVHDRLQETLDTSAFEHAWFEGIRLSFEEALAEAQHLAEC